MSKPGLSSFGAFACAFASSIGSTACWRYHSRTMLDMLKNLGDLPGLMRKAQEMQAKMAAVQEELGRRQISADAGAGMVTATVNGKLELVKLRIDKTKLDVTDTELVEDMTVAAVAAAQRKAAEVIQAEMAKVSGELGLPPGGALPF